MALSTSLSRAVLLSCLVFLGITMCLEAKSLNLKKTNMVFFMHDWENSTKESNITNIPVAGNSHKKWYIVEFGTVFVLDDALTLDFVLDDALTLGIQRNSTEIGRAHGTYINCALDGSDVYLVVSLVFTDKKYNGSTIEIQGSDRLFIKHRDVSVVGGTGLFRMARGWATLETVFLDMINLNAIVKFNLTVYHH